MWKISKKKKDDKTTLLGNPVKTTLEAEASVKYSGMIDQLVQKTTNAVRVIDDTAVDEIRIKTLKNEIYVFQDRYELTFVVHQTPVEETHPE